MNLMGFPLGATQYFKKCIEFGRQENYSGLEPFDLQFIQAKPHFELGIIAMAAGQTTNAIAHFEACLEYDPNFHAATEKLKELS